MMFFNKFFKKRQQTKSDDNFKIILRSEKKLSERQRNAIFSIVKNGIIEGAEMRTIGAKIMIATGIYETVILNRIEEGIEVIF